MVKQLVDKNPNHVVDCLGVGVYLLDLHPHLWTVISNTQNFSMKRDYYPNHKAIYTNFLLCSHFVVQVVSATKNNLVLTPGQLDAILRSTTEKGKTDYDAMCD
jgi:hypothetical protein